MVKELSVKISEELNEQLEKFVEKTGKSKAEVIRDALMFYMGVSTVTDKQVVEAKTYMAPALYSGKCYKCGKTFNQGDTVGFIKVSYDDKSKRVFTYCLDCYVKISDNTMVRLEVQKAKLEQVVSALKREKARMIKEIMEMEKDVEIKSKIDNIIYNLHNYVSTVYKGDSPDVRKLIFELQELNNLIAEYLKRVKVKYSPSQVKYNTYR